MTDLGMMTGKAALRLAKEESGLTRDEIAERLGVSHSVTKRYFNINDTYMPSLEMIPRLCLALGNDILMRWLEARLQGGESFSREEIEEEMVRAANAFEELRTLVNEDPPPSVRDMQHAVNMINGMKSSGKKRDNSGSIGRLLGGMCNSIAEYATKKEGIQPSFFAGSLFDSG